MIISTPPLASKTVAVFPALFKAQLPDTLNAIRQAIPEWTAVHITGQLGGRGATKEEITRELLAQLKPMAAVFDPIYTLSQPLIPPNTIVTLVPDQIRPTFTQQYEGWKYVFYADARTLLDQLFEKALGGMPEGRVGVADALIKGKINGQAVLEGWTGSIGLPGFKRTMEAIIDLDGPVMLWDSAFGFESTGATFLKTADMVLGAFGVKEDRVYFDATNFSWFAAFYPGGQMRVGLLG